MSHFSASSHLEGKLFLERFLPMLELKLKTGLPGVEGASSLLCCCETESLPLEVGNDLTNSEVSLRLSLQSGSEKVSANGLLLMMLLLPLIFPYKLSMGDS